MDEQQKNAIRKVMELHGENWKKELRYYWIKSSYPGVLSSVSGTLQQIRNQFGPPWLSKFKGFN
ncbi:hypothetical protein ACKWMY_24955 [Serratia sp. J2]|uniref:hypothetical protein n=1 Tax=Serratia sp. J2 TaxID=3386551 RepID=UPI00391754A8